MSARNTATEWGWVSKTLHWLIVLAVLGMIAFGLYLDEARESKSLPISDIISLFALHKSIGLTILALMIVRLAWRLSNPTPDLPAEMPAWERLAANGTHWLFYALLFIVPLSGYVVHTNFPIDSPFFGTFPIPKLFKADEGLRDAASEIHELGTWVIVGLVVLHAGAALRHHFMMRDTILIRMLPFTSGR